MAILIYFHIHRILHESCPQLPSGAPIRKLSSIIILTSKFSKQNYIVKISIVIKCVMIYLSTICQQSIQLGDVHAVFWGRRQLLPRHVCKWIRFMVQNMLWDLSFSFPNTIDNTAKLSYSPWLSFEPPRNIRVSKLSSASIET